MPPSSPMTENSLRSTNSFGNAPSLLKWLRRKSKTPPPPSPSPTPLTSSKPLAKSFSSTDSSNSTVNHPTMTTTLPISSTASRHSPSATPSPATPSRLLNITPSRPRRATARQASSMRCVTRASDDLPLTPLPSPPSKIEDMSCVRVSRALNALAKSSPSMLKTTSTPPLRRKRRARRRTNSSLPTSDTSFLTTCNKRSRPRWTTSSPPTARRTLTASPQARRNGTISSPISTSSSNLK